MWKRASVAAVALLVLVAVGGCARASTPWLSSEEYETAKRKVLAVL